jgi:hypothetical protein
VTLSPLHTRQTTVVFNVCLKFIVCNSGILQNLGLILFRLFTKSGSDLLEKKDMIYLRLLLSATSFLVALFCAAVRTFRVLRFVVTLLAPVLAMLRIFDFTDFGTTLER